MVSAEAMVPERERWEKCFKATEVPMRQHGRDASFLRIVPHAQRPKLREGEGNALVHASGMSLEP